VDSGVCIHSFLSIVALRGGFTEFILTFVVLIAISHAMEDQGTSTNAPSAPVPVPQAVAAPPAPVASLAPVSSSEPTPAAAARSVSFDLRSTSATSDAPSPAPAPVSAATTTSASTDPVPPLSTEGPTQTVSRSGRVTTTEAGEGTVEAWNVRTPTPYRAEREGPILDIQEGPETEQQ
jgi:hypothetical protein